MRECRGCTHPRHERHVDAALCVTGRRWHRVRLLHVGGWVDVHGNATTRRSGGGRVRKGRGRNKGTRIYWNWEHVTQNLFRYLSVPTCLKCCSTMEKSVMQVAAEASRFNGVWRGAAVCGVPGVGRCDECAEVARRRRSGVQGAVAVANRRARAWRVQGVAAGGVSCRGCPCVPWMPVCGHAVAALFTLSVNVAAAEGCWLRCGAVFTHCCGGVLRRVAVVCACRPPQGAWTIAEKRPPPCTTPGRWTRRAGANRRRLRGAAAAPAAGLTTAPAPGRQTRRRTGRGMRRGRRGGRTWKPASRTVWARI